MRSVVQVVALRQGFLGGMSTAWTGSGTIVDPSGLILTNCHVANPRAMGMSAPPADRLAIAVTERSDEPPVLTYLAEIAAQSPEIDLAVLRIVGRLDKKQVSGLNLPHVPVGDSDLLELGDRLAILGYPGIGGDTVTFTSGSVSGFTQQKGVSTRRAWIKSDATIAGGNSGGTAVDCDGRLVGIPTQAAAGSEVTPVDARPVVDTNQDGRIDQRDTPMAIGGFINGLRPVNLAKPLLQSAGLVGAKPSQSRVQPQVQPAGRAAEKTAGPALADLAFSGNVAPDGRPVNPTSILPSGGRQLFASFAYSGMQNGLPWGQAWALDGKTIVSKNETWTDGTSGRKVLSLSNSSGLPDGSYHLVVTVQKQVLAEGTVIVGKMTEDTDTEISGTVVEQQTGRGIPDALVIALHPSVRVSDFVQQKRQDMIYASARTDRQGAFTFPRQLTKGQSYGLIAVARGYTDLAIESALRITANAPERAQINPIPLKRE
jgi:S1-C subfamily serine protease